MQPAPHVAIILPVFNDEAWIANALESCLAQTLKAIEIICVDDVSTDGTREIIEQFAERDPRVRLVRQETNQSAFQARRAGISAATAPHVLFLDGDDELDPQAAEKAYAAAQATGADLVGFGVAVLGPDGQAVGGYQARLAPKHRSLEGPAILASLFPVGKPAQGQLWRYLFTTAALRAAYDSMPADLVLKRVNDLPITFLTLAAAERYVSIPDRLYRYYFRRGESGHAVKDLEQFAFYAGAVDSVASIAPAVRSLARKQPDPTPLLASYESVRLSVISNVLGYLFNNVSGDHQDESLALLHTKASAQDVVQAAVRFAPATIEGLARHGRPVPLEGRTVHSVLLTTRTVTTGGVSNVMLSQARYLLEAGFRVTVAVKTAGSAVDLLPPGVELVELKNPPGTARASEWAELCRSREVDVVIDHWALYSRDWAALALVARAQGIPTVAWIHSFSLRPVYNRSDMISFLTTHLHAASAVVGLSPLDAVFWKLRGIEHAAYLPNPPSPLMLEMDASAGPRTRSGSPLRLIWWGRLDQHTKQVRELVSVASELRRLGTDITLTVVGPDGGDLTARALSAEVAEAGLEERVQVVGPLHGDDLVAALDAADLFVSTSIIEGYQLTLAEAQARGLPVAMYELPWLTLVQDNDGIVAVPQGDAHGLARKIAAISADPETYAALSAASLAAAEQARSHDFGELYTQLVKGELPEQYSPEPTIEDARQILDWTMFYTERTISASVSAAAPEGATQGSLARRAVVAAAPRVERTLRKAPWLTPLAQRVARAIGA